MSNTQNEAPMNSIPSADYVRLNGRVYSITPVANEGVDIEQELREFYNQRYNEFVTHFNRSYVNELSNDWDGQLEKLHRVRQRTEVVVPSNMIGRPIICLNGSEIEEVRPVIYSPNIFKMGVSDLCDLLNISYENAGEGRYRYSQNTVTLNTGVEIDLRNIRADQQLIVAVRRRIFHIAIYSFNQRSNRLNCYNLRTFHSQGTSICTGTHSASDFWRNPDFNKEMNIVNCFSLGAREIRYVVDVPGMSTRNQRTYTLNDYVCLDTIINITRREDSQWTT